MRDELSALVRGHLIFLDRERNGCLLIRSIEDDAEEFRGRALDVIDSPGRTLLYGWSLGHQCSGRRRRRYLIVEIAAEAVGSIHSHSHQVAAPKKGPLELPKGISGWFPKH